MSGSDKVREWRKRLSRYSSAGVTVAEFCREEGVSAASFYQWRRRLGRGKLNDTSSRRRPRTASRAFVPVEVVGSSGVLVVLPGGTRIEIPTGDAALLTATLHAVAAWDRESRGDERGPSC